MRLTRSALLTATAALASLGSAGVASAAPSVRLATDRSPIVGRDIGAGEVIGGGIPELRNVCIDRQPALTITASASFNALVGVEIDAFWYPTSLTSGFPQWSLARYAVAPGGSAQIKLGDFERQAALGIDRPVPIGRRPGTGIAVFTPIWKTADGGFGFTAYGRPVQTRTKLTSDPGGACPSGVIVHVQ